MSSNTINVAKVMRESVDIRISPEVIEEVKERLEIEIIPRITEKLAERASNDKPPRKTIQDKDLAFFDYLNWWYQLEGV